MQVWERKAPDLPMRPGKIRRREFESSRHGTQTLMASFDGGSGQVMHALVGDTRTEADDARVQQTLSTAPETTKWHWLMDCLNPSV